MIPIIRETLKARRIGVLAWTLGASAYMLLVTAVYKNFLTQNATQITQPIQQLPDTLKSFVQIKQDFLTPAGFFGSEPYYVILPLIFIMLAVTVGGSILTREEEDRTLELLLSRPISRTRLLLAKGLGGVIELGAVIAAVGIVVTIATRLLNIDISAGVLWKAHLMLFLLALIFGSFTFMLAASGRLVRRASVGLGALLALSGYVLTSLEDQLTSLRIPAKLLPYHYYHPSDILTGSFDTKVALCYAGVIVLFALFAWQGFRQRDIG